MNHPADGPRSVGPAVETRTEGAVEWIGARLTATSRALVCIDGPAGAGKTTLSELLLARHPHAQIVHLDDLYAGWDHALDAALTERLIRHIRKPFVAGEPIRYPRFDWYANRFGDDVEVLETTLLVVEGVGAAQAAMRSAATVSVFIDVDPEVGRTRVIERDGDTSAGHIDDWQRQEQRHFDADGTRRGVDLYLP